MVMVEDKGGAFPIARVVERLTIQEGRKEEASEEAPLQHTATHTQEVTATWYWPASHSTHEEHPRRFTQRRAPLSTGSRTRWRPRPRRHHRPPPPTCHLPAASTTRDQPHHPVSPRPPPPQHYLHLAHHPVWSYECAHHHCVMMSLSNLGQSINEFVSQVIVCHESLGRPVSTRRPILVSCHRCCFIRKSLDLFSLPFGVSLHSHLSRARGRQGRAPGGRHPRVRASSRRPPDIL